MSAPLGSDEDFAAKVVNFGRDDTECDDRVADADADFADLMSCDADDDDEPTAGLVDLDIAGGQDDRGRRFDHKVAWGFGGLVAAGVVATLVAAVALYSHDSGPVAPSGPSLGEPQAVAVAKPSVAANRECRTGG